jgi:predicted Ser/Thr protein kinase
MPEAVLDRAIEDIADGLSVDWKRMEGLATVEDAVEWAKCLRILDDVVNVHRAAAVDFEQTNLAGSWQPDSLRGAPETWGKYRLASKVGEGSYGSVYRAWDSELERDVALKILHRRVGDTRLKESLLQEGRALAKIRHANVVNVLGIEAHEDRVGLCMEFVEGKTLADVVSSGGKLNAPEAALIGQDLCRALSAVHRAGYIHRDVKAKNVMRDDTGRIVLMDFGTGRAIDHEEGQGDRAGTPLYMAPEVLNAHPASRSSDVYSLGVLLYHLLTGEYPVEARTVEELRDAHAKRQHRWLSERRPDLPVKFMQVIERAIALDPEERYAHASELLTALTNLKLGARSRLWKVFTPVIAVAVVVGGTIALGALTSATFNIALRRSDFADETLSDYLAWGRRTSLPPFFILLVVMLAASVVAVVRRLLLTTVVSGRRLDAAIRRNLTKVAHRFRLDEVPVLASCTLLLSAGVALSALWYFLPLALTVLALPIASEDDLALLSPTAVAYHNQYRWVFTLVVIFSVAVWYPVARLIRKGQSAHWGLLAGGAVVACVAMALLHFPYRMLYFSKSFEAATWNDNRCFIVAERGDDVMLFCPELSLPRNRPVKKGDVSPLGVRESPFSRH